MTKPLIKICGVKSTKTARDIVRLGVDWIGIMSHPGSKRFVDIDTADEIAQATRQCGAVPVAVCVDFDLEQILAFCDRTGMTTVQLHGDKARRAQVGLPAKYTRIYVCPVGANGLRPEDEIALNLCDPARDYVLFDNIHGGSGQVFPWNTVQYFGSLRIGIAGGLNHSNVLKVIDQFAPDFVDLASGAENEAGEKDLALIAEIVSKTNPVINTHEDR